MMRLLATLLLLSTTAANAIVIRDDVPDARYRVTVPVLPALADLPGEGHGVLISPKWVVTAAHAVSWHQSVETIDLGGIPRDVRRIVVHPGYRTPPAAMVEAALASGDWAEFFDFMAATDDLALIELSTAVHDIVPIRLHAGPALGAKVRIMGRGATGTGARGHSLNAARRNDLRQGDNRIDVEDGRWIGYSFTMPPDALPLEASMGSGDSGGPLLIAVGNEWQLAGVAAWKRGIVEGTQVFPGRYGEISYGVRLAHYTQWLNETMGR